MKTYFFTNNTSETFTCTFGGQKFKFDAGQTVKMAEDKAMHFAKHLALKVARDQSITNANTIGGLKQSYLQDCSLAAISNEGSIAALENEAEVIESEKTIEIVPVSDEEDLSEVIKKSKKKAAFE